MKQASVIAALSLLQSQGTMGRHMARTAELGSDFSGPLSPAQGKHHYQRVTLSAVLFSFPLVTTAFSGHTDSYPLVA